MTDDNHNQQIRDDFPNLEELKEASEEFVSKLAGAFEYLSKIHEVAPELPVMLASEVCVSLTPSLLISNIAQQRVPLDKIAHKHGFRNIEAMMDEMGLLRK